MCASQTRWRRGGARRALSLLLLLMLALALNSSATASGAEQLDASRLGPLWLHQAGLKISTSEPASSGGGQNSISAKLDELLSKRLGPTIRASSNYKDFQDIKLNESLEAWRLLHDRAGAFASDQAHLYQPQLARLLELANASAACSASLGAFFDSLRRLDAWAVQMWSASGNFPPTGLFDGYFTDLGSYRGCLDIRRPLAKGNRNGTGGGGGDNDDHDGKLEFGSSYCLVGFRPVVPSRRRFHQVYVEESEQLTGLFPPRDAFNAATHFAQYFHYLYWKTAICVPAECSANDLQRAARLVGRQLALMAAPVRCITRAPLTADTKRKLEARAERGQLDEDTQPLTIDFNAKMNGRQWVALALIGGFFAIVLLATIWHALELIGAFLFASDWSAPADQAADDDEREHQATAGGVDVAKSAAGWPEQAGSATSWTGRFRRTCFQNLSMITNGREFADTRVRSNEILCLHGFRVFTMLWIVCVHTLQYNDWSGFSRDFENVASLRNPLVQPLINANYVVDNFFLMSGLLAAYTIWHNNKGVANNFSALRCLIGRYLRLTPQVLLISLAYILLPQIGSGPFWHDMTHHAAKYCEQNWWVNLIHLQAFYREEEMCNLVGWWISVDMLFYLLALPLLWLLLSKRTQLAASLTGALLTYCALSTGWRHYTGGFAPNNLASVPQIGEVWSEFVVDFVWSPQPHAFVFFLGLWLGHLLANRRHYQLIRRHSKLGWLVAGASLLLVNYSTRLWITGVLDLANGPQLLSTSFNLVSVMVWACAFGWMIVACHYGCAPSLNKLLSSDLMIMLSKASFIIYLSHMLILRAFYGSQYNLLEVSIATILIMLVGMCFLSILFGVFLCVAFEGPCLKFQKFVMNSLKPQPRQLPIAGSAFLYEETIQIKETNGNSATHDALATAKQSLSLGPTGAPLLK